MTVTVFVGPTISVPDAEKILNATYLPPVKQGDVRKLVGKVHAIGIIDGQFHSVRSVWHKEILWAMSEGIHVFGSASIGALRAAELNAYGLVGVGRIFEMYRDGILEDDDEVAVIHAPAEQSYVAASVAMVNIRATLISAAESGILKRETADALTASAKELYFPYRKFESLFSCKHLVGTEAKAFRDWLPKGQIDQKRADAIQMLQLMNDRVKNFDSRKNVNYWFEHHPTFS